MSRIKLITIRLYFSTTLGNMYLSLRSKIHQQRPNLTFNISRLRFYFIQGTSRASMRIILPVESQTGLISTTHNPDDQYSATVFVLFLNRISRVKETFCLTYSLALARSSIHSFVFSSHPSLDIHSTFHSSFLAVSHSYSLKIAHANVVTPQARRLTAF